MMMMMIIDCYHDVPADDKNDHANDNLCRGSYDKNNMDLYHDAPATDNDNDHSKDFCWILPRSSERNSLGRMMLCITPIRFVTLK